MVRIDRSFASMLSNFGTTGDKTLADVIRAAGTRERAALAQLAEHGRVTVVVHPGAIALWAITPEGLGTL